MKKKEPRNKTPEQKKAHSERNEYSKYAEYRREYMKNYNRKKNLKLKELEEKVKELEQQINDPEEWRKAFIQKMKDNHGDIDLMNQAYDFFQRGKLTEQDLNEGGVYMMTNARSYLEQQKEQPK